MRSVIWPRNCALIFYCWWCLVSPGYANSTIDASTADGPITDSSTTDNSAPIILVMGDSLSAGFGIDQSLGWVNLMAKRLTSQGYPHRVFNSSISGETSRGGLNRLPDILNNREPDIVIIELGANDGLRGLSLQDMQNNLDKMIALSKKSNAKVLLVGMELPPNYGPAYATGFREIYAQLAKKHNTNLVPFLMDGVENQRELMQDDNLHPNADAQPRLLDNIWPHLQPLLESRK